MGQGLTKINIIFKTIENDGKVVEIGEVEESWKSEEVENSKSRKLKVWIKIKERGKKYSFFFNFPNRIRFLGLRFQILIFSNKKPHKPKKNLHF